MDPLDFDSLVPEHVRQSYLNALRHFAYQSDLTAEEIELAIWSPGSSRPEPPPPEEGKDGITDC